jgi:ribosome-associated protein
MDTQNFTLTTENIELYKLLQLVDLATSGGEAKQIISRGEVSLNGENETRKRKKLVPGDIVIFNATRIMVCANKN